ncbi:hypothetical protein Hypma_010880 [Hypsizygus marmoreus]|uniref:Uncharacterized protein n=1 Tax=Hypsizygus marmoreus TaxID=39966 RepID=A0A369JHS0_HYPMA|nr:hypothetical protein Hypma_010880 [Hypsizygus marmoreus]
MDHRFPLFQDFWSSCASERSGILGTRVLPRALMRQVWRLSAQTFLVLDTTFRPPCIVDASDLRVCRSVFVNTFLRCLFLVFFPDRWTFQDVPDVPVAALMHPRHRKDQTPKTLTSCSTAFFA